MQNYENHPDNADLTAFSFSQLQGPTPDKDSVQIEGIGDFCPVEEHPLLADIVKEAVLDPLHSGQYILQDNAYEETFKQLEATGTHPHSPDKTWYNPYTGQTTTTNNSNIGHHVLTVALVADSLFTMAEQAGLVTADKREECVKRALLHDAVKIPERHIQKAKEDGLIANGNFHGHDHALLTYFLTENGFDQKDAEALCGYGAECGHHSVSRFLKPGTDTLKLVIHEPLEALVHLADDLVSTSLNNAQQQSETRILNFEERAISSDFKNRYPFLYTEGLGFSTGDTELSPVHDMQNPPASLDHCYSYYTMQWYTAEGLARWLQAHVDPLSTEAPGSYVKKAVQDSLRP